MPGTGGMKELAQLLVPAIRWDPSRGFDGERDFIRRALDLGVGGFVLRGGDQEGVRALTKELRNRSRVPLLVGADLERGAGQQFLGASGLPPLAAIASLGDADFVRRAARLTAREARTMGVNWAFGPVCDVDIAPQNPIVGTRAFSGDPSVVADLAAEWIDACQAEGVLACAKHFPGHGRTTVDSHLALPVVDADQDTLMGSDIVPFRAAIDSGVASMMVAHVAYPALDPGGVPATFSREMLQWLLRRQLGYDGLIVSDSLTMAGAHGGRGDAENAVAALRAGCDLLLEPGDLDAVARALDEALAKRVLDKELVHQSIRRRLKYAQWASPPNDYRRPSQTDMAWGASLCDRVVRVERGALTAARFPLEVVVVDDDGGAATVPRHFLAETLARGGEVRRSAEPQLGSGSTLVVALFGEALPGKGRAGYSDATRQRVQQLLDGARTAARDAIVVLFGHPRQAAEIPGAGTVLCAWGGDRAMQEAAGRRLAR
jgi:beta-glucosidase-like glycosyl hydrolase